MRHSNLVRIRFIIVFILCLMPIGLTAEGNYQVSRSADQNLLNSPRQTLHTFFYWQEKGHKAPKKVIQTMQLAKKKSPAEKMELAEKLQAVIQARGVSVDYSKIPAEPNYTDPLSGLHRYTPFPELSEIYLVRRDSSWVFSTATIERIPELYRSTFSVFVDLILDELPPVMYTEWAGLKLWQAIGIFIWLLVGILLRKMFEYLLSNYLVRLTQKTTSGWDDTLLEEMKRPAGYTFLAIYFGATYPVLHLGTTLNLYLGTFLEIALSASIIWLLYKLANVLSDYLYELTERSESKLDDQLVPLLRKTAKVFILLFGILIILQNRGINVASLLAGLGLGGLAFALAARDTLANFFGSLTVFLDKPFVVGDWIKTNEVEGTVEEVGFRSTRIRTFYNSLVSVPNAKLADTEIDNLGLRQYRRVKTTLSLTYSTAPEQLEAFVEGIKAIINANPHMRKDFYEVTFYDYGAHSLDILVYCFLEVPTWSDELQHRHNFFIEIKRLARDLGVEFAFPTQTLHVDSFYGDQPRTPGERRTEEELSNTVLAYGPDGKKANPDGVTLKKDNQEIDFSASLHRSGS